MKKFSLDKNNIFVQKLKHTVSFPSHAHQNLITIENNSFWFKHRNEVIKKIINRFPFEGDLVDIASHYEGETRRAEQFTVVPYPIPRTCVATYFPEANILIPIDSVADKSNTPTSKSVVVTIHTRS